MSKAKQWVEYKTNIKNIKTGQHYATDDGMLFTVVSRPNLSYEGHKELDLIQWRCNENGFVVGAKPNSTGKENIIEYLKIVGGKEVDMNIEYVEAEDTDLYDGTIYEIDGKRVLFFNGSTQSLMCMIGDLTKYQTRAMLRSDFERNILTKAKKKEYIKLRYDK